MHYKVLYFILIFKTLARNDYYRCQQMPFSSNQMFFNWNTCNNTPVNVYTSEIESYSTIRRSHNSTLDNLEEKLALNDHDNLFSL